MIPVERYEEDVFLSRTITGVVAYIFSVQAKIIAYMVQFEEIFRRATQDGLQEEAADRIALEEMNRRLDSLDQLTFSSTGDFEDIYVSSDEVAAQKLQATGTVFAPPPINSVDRMILEIERDPAIPAHARSLLARYLGFLRVHHIMRTNRVLGGYLSGLAGIYWPRDRYNQTRAAQIRDFGESFLRPFRD
jgi:hypothetical protein